MGQRQGHRRSREGAQGPEEDLLFPVLGRVPDGDQAVGRRRAGGAAVRHRRHAQGDERHQSHRDNFIQNCLASRWIVEEIDLETSVEVYATAEQEIRFEDE